MSEEGEKYQTFDNFSTGVQIKTTRFQKRAGDVDNAQNTKFDEVGGVGKKLGYVQRASNLTSTSTTTTTTSTSTTSTTTSTSTTV